MASNQGDVTSGEDAIDLVPIIPWRLCEILQFIQTSETLNRFDVCVSQEDISEMKRAELVMTTMIKLDEFMSARVLRIGNVANNERVMSFLLDNLNFPIFFLNALGKSYNAEVISLSLLQVLATARNVEFQERILKKGNALQRLVSKFERNCRDAIVHAWFQFCAIASAMILNIPPEEERTPEALSQLLYSYKNDTWRKDFPSTIDPEGIRCAWEMATTLVKVQLQELLAVSEKSGGTNTVTMVDFKADFPNWATNFAYELSAYLCQISNAESQQHLINTIRSAFNALVAKLIQNNNILVPDAEAIQLNDSHMLDLLQSIDDGAPYLFDIVFSDKSLCPEINVKNKSDRLFFLRDAWYRCRRDYKNSITLVQYLLSE